MQLILHPLEQEQATGYSDSYTEPGFTIHSIIIRVTAISLGLSGNITFKLQHSADNSDWLDIPDAVTGNITATGTTTATIDTSFTCFDNLRIAWTFTNAHSVTFCGAALGAK